MRLFTAAGKVFHHGCEYADAAENVVVIDSVSKRVFRYGARVGALVTRNQQLIQEASQDLPEPAVHCHAGAGRRCRHVYPLAQGYYDDVLAQYEQRKEALWRALSKLPGVTFNSPRVRSTLWPHCRGDDAGKAASTSCWKSLKIRARRSCSRRRRASIPIG